MARKAVSLGEGRLFATDCGENATDWLEVGASFGCGFILGYPGADYSKYFSSSSSESSSS